MTPRVAVECVGCGEDYATTDAAHDGVSVAGWCSGCRKSRSGTALDRRRIQAGVPERLRRIRMGALEVRRPEDRRAFKLAGDWADGELQGLFLHGPLGTGKTTLAAAAVWARLEREPVRWVNVSALVQRSLSAFSDEERAAAVADITGCGAVVFDDLDKVKPSEWVRSQLYTAVNERYAAGAAVLVTSNLRPSGLAAHLGEPIMSRLAEMCVVAELGGDDRRLEGMA